MQLLNREKLVKINESYGKNDQVWIHFPITGDLVKCNIIEVSKTKALLEMPSDSDLAGCPHFWFNKINIIGKV